MALREPLHGNVILIGMPAAGKTATGQILAAKLRRAFLDTDSLLQLRVGCTPGEFLAEVGRETFRDVEESVVLALEAEAAVVATGGSVVYSSRAVDHLSRLGVIVYLRVDLRTLLTRGLDLATRGVVRAPGQDLASLYRERLPLYERCADVTVNAQQNNPNHTADEIIRTLLGPAVLAPRAQAQAAAGGMSKD